MKTKRVKPYGKSSRLKGYDYSLLGAYFIIIVSYRRENLFGNVIEGQFYSNQYGKLVERAWVDLPSHCHQISLGAFVVMPNHIHGIVIINEPKNEETKDPAEEGAKCGLPEIVRGF
jgi:putative transposase